MDHMYTEATKQILLTSSLQVDLDLGQTVTRTDRTVSEYLQSNNSQAMSSLIIYMK